MRPILLLFPLFLVSCAADHGSGKSARTPGLDVADVALASGAPETALYIAQRSLAKDPQDVSALERVARAQAALGQRDQAARTFNQVLSIKPNDAVAELGLGRVLLATDPAAAEHALLGLTKRDTHNVAALVDLGIARDLLGRHAEAQSTYRLALAVDPGNLAGQVNLGLSLALSGDARQALTYLRPVAQRSGASRRVRQDLAVALALDGNDNEAAAVLGVDIPQPEVRTTVASFHLLQSMP